MDPILYSLDIGVALVDLVVEEPTLRSEEPEPQREAA